MADSPVPIAHVEQYRVRFDEGGADGALRTSVYLRYMQDAASAHSSALGYTRERYRAEGLFWLVRHVDLRIEAPSYPGETLSVSTEVLGFRRIWARRRSEFRAANGALRAESVIDWVLTSSAGRPTRVPEDIVRAFPGLPGDYTPGRLQLPEPPAGAVELRRRAEPHEVDPLGHVNNAAYLDQFEAGLEDGIAPMLRTAVPRRYRIQYLSAGLPGATLTWRLWPMGPAAAGSLLDERGAEIVRVLAERGRRRVPDPHSCQIRGAPTLPRSLGPSSRSEARPTARYPT